MNLISKHVISRQPLSLAVIGGSLLSAVGYAHFVACRMDRKWSIEAGCFSTDDLDNTETALAYGVAVDRTYPDWRKMVANECERVDAILILTPTPSHFEMVVACLESGIPVVCEKSLAIRSNEVRKIIDVRNANNGFLAITYNYTGYPMVRELRQLINSGRLGKILHFQAEMPQEGFVRVDVKGEKPIPQAWRLTDAEVPTIHLDLAVHLHQLIHYLIGQKPLSVVADQASKGWFHEVIDNVMCLARYSDDVQGQFWFSKSALGNRNGLTIRIYGSKGSAEWCQVNPEEIWLAYSDGRREILDRSSFVSIADKPRYNRFKSGHPAGFLEAFANLYYDIADGLLMYQETGKWNSEEVYGAELALDGQFFLEAIVESARINTWRKVSSRYGI